MRAGMLDTERVDKESSTLKNGSGYQEIKNVDL